MRGVFERGAKIAASAELEQQLRFINVSA